MQKTDSTPGCSCSMVGLTWDSFEFLSKDMLVRYEMGAGVSVWAAYKPEGFSMFGRGIVEDCGQNSPPSGLIQKLETLFKAYVFVFALIMGSSTPHFQLEMKFINELLPAFPVLPPSCSWWHPKAHHFWPGYQFWQGFVPLIWPWFDHCPLSVTDTWVRRAFGSVFCCNVLQCFQKKMRYVAVLLPLLPQVLSGLRGVTVSVPGDQKYWFSAVTDCFSRVVLKSAPDVPCLIILRLELKLLISSAPTPCPPLNWFFSPTWESSLAFPTEKMQFLKLATSNTQIPIEWAGHLTS